MVELVSSCQIGGLVRKVRKEKGLTQDDLANLAGVSKRLVVSLEAGTASGIGLDRLLSIMDALGVKLCADITDDAQGHESEGIASARGRTVRSLPVLGDGSLDDAVRTQRRLYAGMTRSAEKGRR